jgi:VanZ family protein
MKPILKYYGPTILWALFVLFICGVNLGPVSETHTFFAGFDKLTHTGLFFTFTVLCCNGFIRQQKPPSFPYKQLAVVAFIAIFYGGLIEILQLEVFTWRDGDWNDMFCDVLGVCMGIFGVTLTFGAIGNEKK